MNHFLQVNMPDGIVYEVPAAAVIRHRAAELRRTLPAQFPTEESAMTYAQDRMPDDQEMIAWARAHITWRELLPYARMISHHSRDDNDAWREGGIAEVTSHAVAAELSAPDGQNLARRPFGLLLSQMATDNSIFCQTLKINRPDGGTAAAVAIFTGGEAIIAEYLKGLELMTRVFAQRAERAAAAANNNAEMVEPAKNQIH